MGITNGLGESTMKNDRKMIKADLLDPVVRMSLLPDEFSRELG